MAVRIQLRRDSSENWENNNPVLADGEPAWDKTNSILKIGDGIKTWTELDSFSPGGGGGLAENGVPPGGTTNQLAAKNSGDDYDLKWMDAPEAANGVPAGGTESQLAAKNSDDDYDIKWVDAPQAANGIPDEGTTGQILAKNSDDDYDTKWVDKAESLYVTLVSTDWEDNEQTVDAEGVTETNIVIVSPKPENQDDYTQGGIICVEQGDETLTFTCKTEPGTDIEVGVVIL